MSRMRYRVYLREKQVKRENELVNRQCIVTVFRIFIFFQSMSNIAAQEYSQSDVQADRTIQHGTSVFSVNEDVPPYKTRSFLQANFPSLTNSNYTAFMQIKPNHIGVTQHLNLPAKVKVSSTPGIYPSLELLDFGTLQTQDKAKVLSIFLLNSGSKETQITSISEQPENLAVHIDFQPIRLKFSGTVFTKVASVSFNVQHITNEKQWSGKVIVRTKEENYVNLYISYQAITLNGTLGYDERATYLHVYRMESTSIVEQNISLTNTFSFPVVLCSVELHDDASSFYKVVNAAFPCTILPEETDVCFMVQFLSDSFFSMNSYWNDIVGTTHHVALFTNTSTLPFPLHTFSGLLSSLRETSSQRMWFDYTLDGKTNQSCLNLFLNPGQKQTIDVNFSPVYNVMASSAIILRNNLTVLDAVSVRGLGVREELKVGERLSNNLKVSLRFELTSTLLRDCKAEYRKETPNFTVRKSFAAKNIGMLPLQVLYMMIDKYHCEGYGFRILNCEAFLLQPNATRDIIIAYTPDFTQSLVLHTLRIFTSQGSMLTYALNVTLPHYMLTTCQAAIPRPDWESSLGYIIRIVIVMMFFGLLLTAYWEAMFIRENWEQENCRGRTEADVDTKRTKFDLRQIARKFDKYSRLKRSHGILGLIKSTISKLLSFELLHLFGGWKLALSHLQVCEESFNVDPENLFDETKLLPIARNSPVRELGRGGNVRSRQRRKSKSNHNSRVPGWNAGRNRNASKSGDCEKIPEMISNPHSWTLSEPSTDVAKKCNEKILRKTSSSCSVESCESGGDCVTCELDKNKTTLKMFEGKERKCKNMSNTSKSFNHNFDDSTSITTEKPSENMDEKQTYFDDSWKVNRKKPVGSSNYKVKDNKTRLEQSYVITNAVTLEHSAKRHNSGSSIIKKSPKYEVQTAFKPRPRKSFDLRKPPPLTLLSFCKTGSTDGQLANQKQDPDAIMRSLAEKKRKFDRRKIQSKSFSNDKANNSFKSVLLNMTNASKPPISGSKTPQHPSNKPTATRSVPTRFPVSSPINTQQIERPHNRGKRNNDLTFPVFAVSESTPIKSLLPPLNLTNNFPSWDNFGRNTFISTEDWNYGLMACASTIKPSVSINNATTSSYWDSFPPSMYSNAEMANSDWATFNLQTSSVCSPVTPRFSPMQHKAVRDGPSLSSVSRSTHEIWSVRNAVTMDENRNTIENDPLGLKRIWN